MKWRGGGRKTSVKHCMQIGGRNSSNAVISILVESATVPVTGIREWEAIRRHFVRRGPEVGA